MGALDTNILVYAEGLSSSIDDDRKVSISRALLNASIEQQHGCIVAAQALVELHYVLVRRGRLTRMQARQRVARIAENAIVVATTAELLATAFDLAVRHNIQTFDSIILAAAVEARCDMLYSEDFQHGFVWRGVEVVNPFL